MPTLDFNVAVSDSSLKEMEQKFRLFQKRMTRNMGRMADRKPSMMGAAMFGSQKGQGNRTNKGFVKDAKLAEKAWKQASGVLSVGLQKASGVAKRLRGVFSDVAGNLRKVTSEFERVSKKLEKAGRKTGGGGNVGGGGTKRRGGLVGRVAGRTLGVIGGGILGFMGAAYNTAIQSYEQTAQAQLQAAPMLMGYRGYGPGAFKTSGKATALGYNKAQSIQMQAQAAQAGLGRSAAAGTLAMELSRSLGPGGLQLAGQMRTRMGAGIEKNQFAKIQKQLGSVIAAGLASGLRQERVGEMLQAANNYAEKQLSVMVTKDDYMNFTKELSLLQSSGKAGLMGRRGAAVLNQIDSAIKGAGGAQQTLIMRALGFGKGKSYYDVLKRQERGIAGGNLGAIMQQLGKEYGYNKKGGLSQQGVLAFKRMGFGSLHLGEELSKIYVQQKTGKLSAADAKKRIQRAIDKEKTAKMPTLQRNAYRAMAGFGGVAKTMAKRMSQMVEYGKQWYPIKKSMVDLQIAMTSVVAPILTKMAQYMPKLVLSLTRLSIGASAFFRSRGGFRAKSLAAGKAIDEYDRGLLKARIRDLDRRIKQRDAYRQKIRDMGVPQLRREAQEHAAINDPLRVQARGLLRQRMREQLIRDVKYARAGTLADTRANPKWDELLQAIKGLKFENQTSTRMYINIGGKRVPVSDVQKRIDSIQQTQVKASPKRRTGGKS